MLLNSSTQFVVKPEGVNKVFLIIFDWNSGGSMKTGGLRGTRGGLNPPDKSNTA